ncbi:MAG: glutamine amidotransferase [candidate division WOR-3 bacterium]|nr:glutamine amidotransferase [candidate division WOR-3 bacterium]
MRILHLYYDLMNTYGDRGNVIVLYEVAEKMNLNPQIIRYTVGDKIPPRSDFIFIGGGEDWQQEIIYRDFMNLKNYILEHIEEGKPLLAICGGYQLLGKYYRTQDGKVIEGLNIFNIYTVSGNRRMVGNLIVESRFGKLVGFENHSGKTYIEGSALGKVIMGDGNNSEDKTEGYIYKSAIGTYMHGPFLSKNPEVVKYIISSIIKDKVDLDFSLELKAKQKTLQFKRLNEGRF